MAIAFTKIICCVLSSIVFSGLCLEQKNVALSCSVAADCMRCGNNSLLHPVIGFILCDLNAKSFTYAMLESGCGMALKADEQKGPPAQEIELAVR